MAKASVQITVCDVCGEEAANTWNFHGPEGTFLAELCDEHDEELRTVLGRFNQEISEERPSKRGELTADFQNRLRILPDDVG